MWESYDEMCEEYRIHGIAKSMLTEITGAKFNEFHKGKKFYKFLWDNLCHHGIFYKLGLNEDIRPFNPKGECSSGGLYFCEENECDMFWNKFGSKVALVEIPNDARVYVEKHKFKADKIVLISITDFKDVPDEFWINIIPKDGMALRHVNVQTEDLCAMAIKQNIRAYSYVKNMTPRLEELYRGQIDRKFPSLDLVLPSPILPPILTPNTNPNINPNININLSQIIGRILGAGVLNLSENIVYPRLVDVVDAKAEYFEKAKS